MSTIRKGLIIVEINRAISLIDYNIYNDIDKRMEFIQRTVLANNSFTNDEETYAIKEINLIRDKNKILYNTGTKRICENCNQECLATLYCEYCIRNYLKENFSNWTSGNDDIDNLIQKCQLETIETDKVIEWIPYDHLQNIKYLTKGGCSEIYAAEHIDGIYTEWDSKEQQLKRFGKHTVILKSLKDVRRANQRWFEEAKSHLTISNKWPEIIKCHGLTQNPSNGNYMLVMNKEDANLREYLQQNHNQLIWKDRIKIAYDIIVGILRIHYENAIHRDLHSGNILFSQEHPRFDIGDLGFCGPANKPSNSIYGNLPYIAPEVIIGKQTTFKSDIYSIGMLMWEISSGEPPFIKYEHDNDLVMNVIKGMRPRIIPGTPPEYISLMKQCWDADPLKRPDIRSLWNKIREVIRLYQNMPNESEANNNLNKTSDLEANYTSKTFTSKVHQFENLPEPRNATEEEQEAFYSKSCDLHISDNINSKKLSKLFKKLRIKHDPKK